MYTIQREDEIRFLGAEYASLYAKANATAFQSGMWLDHLYQMLVPARGAKPCIITIRTAGEQRLVGLLPMVRRRRMLARTVEYADLGVSDYAAPVIDSEHQRLILADPSVASRVRAALGGFDLLRIERVPDDPAPLGDLISGARSQEHLYGAHLVGLDVDVESWHGGLEPRFTRHLNKAYKRLRSKGGHTFRAVTSESEVDAVLETLRQFRAARFGERGGLDLVQDPDCYEFYRAVARDGAEGRGPARLSVLRVGEEIGAVALNLLQDDRELHLLVGYDFARLRNYSLGLLAVDQMAQSAIDRGLQHLDLTVGDEPYKIDFKAKRRPLFQLTVVRTPGGWIALKGHIAYLWARRTAKKALTEWQKLRKRFVDRRNERKQAQS